MSNLNYTQSLLELQRKSEDRPRHPLLIDLVVERVFAHLHKDSLLTARRVCRQWRWLASSCLKRLELPEVDLSTSCHIYEFLSVVRSMPPPLPWHSFSLHCLGKDVKANDIQLFLDICAPSVQRLCISPAMSPDLVDLFRLLLREVPLVQSLRFEGLRSLVTNQLNQSVSKYMNFDYGVNRVEEFLKWYESMEPRPKFSKLEDLRIVLQIEMDTPEPSFNFFCKLFETTPKLSCLNVSCLDITAESTTIPGLVRALLLSPVLSQLSELRIDDLDDESLRNLARQDKLTLKKLSLVALSHDVHEESISALLQGQATYLQELSLGGQYCCGGGDLQLRLNKNMPCLKVLNFVGGLYIGSHFEYIKVISWEDIQYQQQFPCLETLGLWYLTQHAMNSLFPEDKDSIPCTALRTLEFIGGVEAIDANELRILGSYFPDTENLNVTIAHQQSISAIFKLWPNLNSVDIRIISVIPQLDFHFATHCASCFPSSVSLNNVPQADDGANKECCITCLKGLTKLVVHMDFQPGRSGPWLRRADLHEYLTNATATRLLLLKKLKHLQINRSRITLEGVQTLRRQLSLEKCLIGSENGNIIDFDLTEDALMESEEEYFSADEI